MKAVRVRADLISVAVGPWYMMFLVRAGGGEATRKVTHESFESEHNQGPGSRRSDSVSRNRFGKPALIVERTTRSGRKRGAIGLCSYRDHVWQDPDDIVHLVSGFCWWVPLSLPHVHQKFICTMSK
jgi:hypothetical protein